MRTRTRTTTDNDFDTSDSNKLLLQVFNSLEASEFMSVVGIDTNFNIMKKIIRKGMEYKVPRKLSFLRVKEKLEGRLVYRKTNEFFEDLYAIFDSVHYFSNPSSRLYVISEGLRHLTKSLEDKYVTRLKCKGLIYKGRIKSKRMNELKGNVNTTGDEGCLNDFVLSVPVKDNTEIRENVMKSYSDNDFILKAKVRVEDTTLEHDMNIVTEDDEIMDSDVGQNLEIQNIDTNNFDIDNNSQEVHGGNQNPRMYDYENFVLKVKIIPVVITVQENVVMDPMEDDDATIIENTVINGSVEPTHNAEEMIVDAEDIFVPEKQTDIMMNVEMQEEVYPKGEGIESLIPNSIIPNPNLEENIEIQEVVQIDVPEVIQIDVSEVIKGDVLEKTQADVLEKIQADVPEVIQAEIPEVIQDNEIQVDVQMIQVDNSEVIMGHPQQEFNEKVQQEIQDEVQQEFEEKVQHDADKSIEKVDQNETSNLMIESSGLFPPEVISNDNIPNESNLLKTDYSTILQKGAETFAKERKKKLQQRYNLFNTRLTEDERKWIDESSSQLSHKDQGDFVDLIETINKEAHNNELEESVEILLDKLTKSDLEKIKE
jgi:hypothetical protein